MHSNICTIAATEYIEGSLCQDAHGVVAVGDAEAVQVVDGATELGNPPSRVHRVEAMRGGTNTTESDHAKRKMRPTVLSFVLAAHLHVCGCVHVFVCACVFEPFLLSHIIVVPLSW